MQPLLDMDVKEGGVRANLSKHQKTERIPEDNPPLGSSPQVLGKVEALVELD